MCGECLRKCGVVLGEVEAGVANVVLVLCNDKVCGEYVWATVCDAAAEATAQHKRLMLPHTCYLIPC